MGMEGVGKWGFLWGDGCEEEGVGVWRYVRLWVWVGVGSLVWRWM